MPDYAKRIDASASNNLSDLPAPPYPSDTQLPPLTRDQIIEIAVHGFGAVRHEVEAVVNAMISSGQFVPGDS